MSHHLWWLIIIPGRIQKLVSVYSENPKSYFHSSSEVIISIFCAKSKYFILSKKHFQMLTASGHYFQKFSSQFTCKFRQKMLQKTSPDMSKSDAV